MFSLSVGIAVSKVLYGARSLPWLACFLDGWRFAASRVREGRTSLADRSSRERRGLAGGASGSSSEESSVWEGAMMGERKKDRTITSTNKLVVWCGTRGRGHWIFPCSYCSARLPTRQGLRSHTSQSISCREKHYRLYAAAGSDFESDGEVGELEDQDSDVEMEPAGPMEIQEAEPEPDHDELMDEDETFDPPACDIEIPATGPGTPAADPGKHHRATVEEVEDEDDRWTQDFPEAFEAGAVLEACKTQLEKLRDEQKAAGRVPWEPFESEDEWELARWLMTSGISLKKTDEFLKLTKVRTMDPSFHNSRAFLKRVDALPEGPEWFCHPFELLGDELDADGNPKKEVLELWHRDPIECVRELLGNPAFTNQGYAPFRVFKNGNRTNREYSEMWTADFIVPGTPARRLDACPDHHLVRQDTA
ncbi:hypothetical protein B0H10DRAFT_2116493, partial [Mycena sp. CBHHK59/15]